MRVIWTAQAQLDREDIWAFIAAESSRGAARMDALFSVAAARLGQYPMLGQTGLVAGTRELLAHESYRLVYEIEVDVLWVLTLVHTARQWPPVR